jgi:hypothetical protein
MRTLPAAIWTRPERNKAQVLLISLPLFSYIPFGSLIFLSVRAKDYTGHQD